MILRLEERIIISALKYTYCMVMIITLNLILIRNIHFIAIGLINHETLDAFQMIRKRNFILHKLSHRKNEASFLHNRLLYVYGLEKLI